MKYTEVVCEGNHKGCPYRRPPFVLRTFPPRSGETLPHPPSFPRTPSVIPAKAGMTVVVHSTRRGRDDF